MADDSADTRAHLAAENQYYSNMTAATKVLQAQLKAGIQDRQQTYIPLELAMVALMPPWRCGPSFPATDVTGRLDTLLKSLVG